jgi:hypothetical protein
MFFRTSKYQFDARPERPDLIFVEIPQQPLCGKWGEVSVTSGGSNCRRPNKEVILDIHTKNGASGHARNHERSGVSDAARRVPRRCQTMCDNTGSSEDSRLHGAPASWRFATATSPGPPD